MKLFGGLGGLAKEQKEKEEEHQKWKERRAGLKLRQIMQNRRLHDAGLSNPTEVDRLIIHRHLGYKAMCPGIAQW